jgi:Gluconate 2-dehydrogenase subunit 3
MRRAQVDGETQSGSELDLQLSRRTVLGGTVATFMSLMLARAGAAPTAQRSSSDPRYAFAERLCDLVIPDTDTPGGAKARAAEFVLLAVDHAMNDLDGTALAAVREALQPAGGDFLQLVPAEQARLLEALDARAFARSGSGSVGSPELAWQRLKPAIIAGYYTSEIGASQELVYEPVPGPERGNFTLTPEYRSRSNEGFGGTL